MLQLGAWLFDMPLPAASQGPLFLPAPIYVAGLIAPGVAISTLRQTLQQAIFLSIFLLIPSILLSGFTFPVETMPDYIQPVSWLLPSPGLSKSFASAVQGKQPGRPDCNYLALLGCAMAFTGISIVRFRKYPG